MSEMIEEEAAPGAPMWMATFADLMSLLMCFFVLLLSFSEMDAQKYKLVAGSMKNAFGVQKQIVANESPSGSSSLTENIMQDGGLSTISEEELENLQKAEMIEKIEALVFETTEDVEKIEESMKDEVGSGFIELESGFRTITVRIKEKGSFGSGSADLQDGFVPVMSKLRTVLADIEGQISVEGHTDNIDISTARFSSNWALSSARALSVGNELLAGDILDHTRFVISGYADTVPFSDNATTDGRAANRRVEIIIRQPVSQEVSAGIRDLDESDPAVAEALDGASTENIRPQ